VLLVPLPLPLIHNPSVSQTGIATHRTFTPSPDTSVLSVELLAAIADDDDVVVALTARYGFIRLLSQHVVNRM
jgi:hypothetical protein